MAKPPREIVKMYVAWEKVNHEYFVELTADLSDGHNDWKVGRNSLPSPEEMVKFLNALWDAYGQGNVLFRHKSQKKWSAVCPDEDDIAEKVKAA